MQPLAQYPEAIELVRRFRQLHVLVIGDVMLDTYLEGEAARLCSEGPVPVVSKTLEQRLPGGAANTAANLRALEADVSLLGVIGRDLAGSLLRSTLQELHLPIEWLVEDEMLPTQHKLRILANGQYVVRFDDGSARSPHASPYTQQSQQQLLAFLEELYARCDVIVISDYCYGVIWDGLLERLRTLHSERPKPILVDSKALQRFKELPVTVVTPNYSEARMLVGDGGKSERATHEEAEGPANLEHVERIGRQMLEMLVTEHVAITLAEHGVLLLDRQNPATHLPAHPVAHANDVGAGDSFAAAAALGIAAGGSLSEAVQIGIDAAAIAVSKQRTTSVGYQELLQRVSLRAYTMQAHSEGSNSLTQLQAQLEVERLLGRTLVFTNGVFDILHAGHVHFLRQAKALGDVLIVGVNSDSGTRRLKGDRRPINSERDRLALVAALDMVDHVLLFDEDTPTELIRALRPHIHVKGGDYADEELPEAEAVRAGGGRVVILPLVGQMSTSRVISRIVALAGEQASGNSTEQSSPGVLHMNRENSAGEQNVHARGESYD